MERIRIFVGMDRPDRYDLNPRAGKYCSFCSKNVIGEEMNECWHKGHFDEPKYRWLEFNKDINNMTILEQLHAGAITYVCPKCNKPGFPSMYLPLCTDCANLERKAKGEI